jgi:hypothetical protein
MTAVTAVPKMKGSAPNLATVGAQTRPLTNPKPP